MQSRTEFDDPNPSKLPGARRASGNFGPELPSNPPDPQVLEKAKRRTFDAAYRLRIVREADSLAGTGKVGEFAA